MHKTFSITVTRIFSVTLLACVLSFTLSCSPEKKDARKTANAIAKHIPVEQAAPEFAQNAIKIASSFRVPGADTVFLGYYLGMDRKAYQEQTKANLMAKKIKFDSDEKIFYYNLHVFYNNQDVVLDCDIKPYFYKDTLSRLKLEYFHYERALALYPKPLPVPFEDALTVLDNAVREKFLSDGRIRYEFNDIISYYKGNTLCGPTIYREESEYGNVSTYYSIEFCDCIIATEIDNARKKKADSEKKEAEEKVRNQAQSDF